jgi:hypothetical protein
MLRSLNSPWFYQPNIMSLGYQIMKILAVQFQCNTQLCGNEQVTLTEMLV